MNLNLPFTTDMKGGSKKTFKLLNSKQLTNRIKKNKTMINLIQNLMSSNAANNSEKLNYVKASSTQEYYNALSKKKIYK